MDYEQVPTNPSNPENAVPITWPGAFGLYKYSKQAVKLNWVTVLSLILLVLLLSVVGSVITSGVQSLAFHIVITLAIELISVVITMASYFVYLAGMRGQKMSVNEALSKCSPLLTVKYIALMIVSAFIITGSLLLFIVPFFFILPRLFLAPYFLLDKNMGPVEALSASWHATEGHALKIWSVILATIAMALLFFTIVGVPFAAYFLFMYGASMAIVYGFATQSHKTE